jgi:hypothetical protein
VPHWGRLQVELRRQLAAEVELAMKVAVLLEMEVPQLAIADRLGVGLVDIKRALARLRDIAPQPERDQEHAHE